MSDDILFTQELGGVLKRIMGQLRPNPNADKLQAEIDEFTDRMVHEGLCRVLWVPWDV